MPDLSRDTQIFPLTNGRFILAVTVGERTQTIDLDRRSLTLVARQTAPWADNTPAFADPEE